MKLAIRALLKSPGYSVVTLVTLILGVGSATAIFSILYAVLLNPLQYRDPDSLVWLRSRHPAQGTTGVASATFGELHAANQSFERLAMRAWSESAFTRDGTPVNANVVQATADYFQVLGVAPRLGRTWDVAETVSGAAPVVVLSERFFARHFGSDPAVVGTSILLDDVSRRVIGVMPESFRDPVNPATDTLVFVPATMTEARLRDRGGRYWGVIGRLKPGVTRAAASAELAAVGQRLERDFGEIYSGWTLEAIGLHERIVLRVRSGIWLAAGAVGCLLLITCTNLAGLALVRALGRRREFAIRAAMGGSRRQLVGLLLRECLLLSAPAALGGVALAHFGLRALVASFPAGWMPRADEVAINPLVLAVALAVTLGVTLAVGLLPALVSAAAHPRDAMGEGGRGSVGPRMRFLQGTLVVAQIAFALALLSGAGLLARSFLAVLNRDAGVDPAQVLSLTLALTSRRYDTMEKRVNLMQRIEHEVRAVPGVDAVGITQTPPFRTGWSPSPFRPVGASQVGEGASVSAYSDSVNADFFHAMKVPLLQGRNFETGDTMSAPRVVVLSQAAARRMFGEENPVGRSLARPGGGDTAQIVGVVGDMRRDGLAAEVPLQVYRPLTQHVSQLATLLVRSALPPESLRRVVEAAVWRVDPALPLSDVAPLATVVGQTVVLPRLHLRLFVLCSGIALFLSVLGVHAVAAYSVGQRVREFGIRSALGAAPRAVLAQVLGESSRLIVIGVGLGLAVALLGADLLRSMIYDISAYDPWVLAGAPAVLATVAVLACLAPARRAMRVSPVVALRGD